MVRVIRIVLVFVLLTAMLSGCGVQDESDASSSSTPPTTLADSTTTSVTVAALDDASSCAHSEIKSERVVLQSGDTFTTSQTRTPILQFVAVGEARWVASDSLACGYELGSLIMTTRYGRMFVVPTTDITIDSAAELLMRGPFNLASSETVNLAGTSGLRVSGFLDASVAQISLGPGRSVVQSSRDSYPWVLPYHTVVEDVLDPSDGGPLLPGNSVEITVVPTSDGVLTVLLVAEDALSMEPLAVDAYSIAETIEILPGPENEEPSC